MVLYGIEVPLKNIPAADPEFVPFGLFQDAFLKDACLPVSVALERENGLVSVYRTFLHGDPAHEAADFFYLERLIKFLLWSRGGWRISISGCEKAAAYIARLYQPDGARAFDRQTMETIYEKNFEVVSCSPENLPADTEGASPVGGFSDGCRIGIDVGGSNRKVCAIMDGTMVYSATEPWQPVTNADPDYHIGELTASLRRAAASLPRVDAIGISTAGVFVNCRARIASIYRGVPKELFEEKITDIYPRVCAALGEGVPFAVANDGDVAALAGSISAGGVGSVVGVSLGTSQAGGYVDRNGGITGWLNEFAFVPVDMRQTGVDAWSGDAGCGVSYLSSEAVARLAEQLGISGRTDSAELQDRVREVQELVRQGDENAAAVFDTIGCYLAHAIYTYSKFYEMEHVIVMGGVSAGPGGAVLIRRCRQVLQDEYPELKTDLIVPEGETRAAGQSFAAATLVKLS